jgi:hypothetical protein
MEYIVEHYQKRETSEIMNYERNEMEVYELIIYKKE